MTELADALQQLRDDAHLNQGALAAVCAQAQIKFDAVRTWPDSTMKRELLRQLAPTITAYRTAQRDALALRDKSAAALAGMTNGPAPELPASNMATVAWSVSAW